MLCTILYVKCFLLSCDDNMKPCETQMLQIVTLHGGYLYQIAHFCIINLTKSAIGGFRRAKEAMPPQDAKITFFALNMRCILKFCSKTNKIYTQCMQGQNSFCFWGCTQVTGFSQEVHFCFRLLVSIFGPCTHVHSLF